MFDALNEIEKEYYLKLARELLKGTFVECNDCSIHGGSGFFISSYKDEKKLEEVAEKIYNFHKKVALPHFDSVLCSNEKV